MMPDLIYLATPYSDPDPAVRFNRFDAVNRFAARLIEQGHYVYSPISHTHPIAVCGDLPKGWEYWEGFDRRMIAACDRVVVYCQDGWQESVGVTAEIKIARELKKPVDFIGHVPPIRFPPPSIELIRNRYPSPGESW